MITRSERRGGDPVRTLERIVETGVLVIAQAGAHADVDYVREAFSAVAGDVTAQLTAFADRATAEVTATLGRLFDPTRGKSRR